MIVSVYLPLLVCAGVALLAAPASRRLPPGLGAWAMVCAALTGAVTSAWSLVLLAASLLDDVSPYGRVGPIVPVPDAVSACAAAGLVACGVRTIRSAAKYRRDVAALHSLVTPGDQLVVADTDDADAFAIPARGWRTSGTVYVTSGMLRALDPAQQRALFAHERAHLAARHGTARFLATLAAAANPLLMPVRDAVAYLCERQADESAAAATGSRVLVAQTVATAALAQSTARPSAAPALHRLAVTDRVTAMLAARPVRQRWQVWLLAAAIALPAVALPAVAMLDATTDFATIASAIL